MKISRNFYLLEHLVYRPTFCIIPELKEITKIMESILSSSVHEGIVFTTSRKFHEVFMTIWTLGTVTTYIIGMYTKSSIATLVWLI